MTQSLADASAPINPATGVSLPSLEAPVTIANALPLLKNPEAREWVKTIPALGRNSLKYAVLHVDPNTNLTTLMFRTPVAVHIKPHTHDLVETHVVLIGGTHVFKSSDVLYNVEHGGFFKHRRLVWFTRCGFPQDHRP